MERERTTGKGLGLVPSGKCYREWLRDVGLTTQSQPSTFPSKTFTLTCFQMGKSAHWHPAMDQTWCST